LCWLESEEGLIDPLCRIQRVQTLAPSVSGKMTKPSACARGALARCLNSLSQAASAEALPVGRLEAGRALAPLAAMLLQVPASVKQRLLSASDLPSLLRDEASLLRGEAAGLTIALHGIDTVERVPPMVTSHSTRLRLPAHAILLDCGSSML